MFRFGTRAVKMISMALMLPNFGMHFVSSFGPSTYHTARYTIQGCDCMSMRQLSRNNFSMLLPTFFHFLGHHFWVPFSGPIFAALYHFKRKFDWSQRSYVQNWAPVFGVQKLHYFWYFFRKNAFLHMSKNMHLLAVQTTVLHPTCTNLPGIELRGHEGKIMKILDLASGTAPSQKLVRN